MAPSPTAPLGEYFDSSVEEAMKITSKGQVTIPIEIREKLGLLPYTEVEFEIVGDWVRLKKREDSERRGSALVDHLKGRATKGLSTDEILALTRGEDQ